MYVGHLEYRPDRLDPVQINRAEMFVILVGRIHCRMLWRPRGPDYTTIGTISYENFRKLKQDMFVHPVGTMQSCLAGKSAGICIPISHAGPLAAKWQQNVQINESWADSPLAKPE